MPGKCFSFPCNVKILKIDPCGYLKEALELLKDHMAFALTRIGPAGRGEHRFPVSRKGCFRKTGKQDFRLRRIPRADRETCIWSISSIQNNQQRNRCDPCKH